MVRVKKNGEIYIKILYWGCSGAGKTTSVDTLFRLTKKKFSDEVHSHGELTKIAMKSGSTLYFDRGLFQSRLEPSLYYHVYTVAGQKNFSNIRKKVYQGTDGIIFVWDGQRSRLEDNLDSLRELKKVAKGSLNIEIPLMVMINKEDLNNTVSEKEVQDILRDEDLYSLVEGLDAETDPIVKKTCALYDQNNNVYEFFMETCKRTYAFQQDPAFFISFRARYF